MIRFFGFVDEVASDGQILGWACRPGHVQRLHVAIRHQGTLIGECVAQNFRADLLAAGHGLGHCAFSARPKCHLPPGTYDLNLSLLGVDAETHISTVVVQEYDNRNSSKPAKPYWTDEDILENLPMFSLMEQYHALGPDRFADGVFQFVLGRWPEPSMHEAVQRAHAANVFDPQAFMREVILSDERRPKRTEPLPSPFDHRFPFRYPPLLTNRDRPA